MTESKTTTPTKEELEWAIHETEYKYFGDYKFSESQWKAVDILVKNAMATMEKLP